MPELSAEDALKLDLQLKEQRRTVDFDTADVLTRQLLLLLQSGEISIAPAYQRLFRWTKKQASQFIESMLLGIPIPSLFMATTAPENRSEVVDGVQRLTTIVWFAGDDELRRQLKLQNGPLCLEQLEKLTEFNGLCFTDLPEALQRLFLGRSIKVITLNDKSDDIVRYDLFERINTGGVELSPQEIRNCIYSKPEQTKFKEHLQRWAREANFRKVLRLTPKQERDATADECVLRFFAYLYRYKSFEHNVTLFLNEYMRDASMDFDFKKGEDIFNKTFKELARIFPDGIRRQPGNQKNTPLNLFEGITVGAALALQHSASLKVNHLKTWLESAELRDFTTGATNDRSAVKGRIEFCRDRFLGKPYVPTASD
jgi:hypothetical protein